MSQNPFESPREIPRVVGVNSGTREDLRKVAQYQKGILVSILVYLLAVVGQFAIPDQLKILVLLAVVVAGLAGFVFVLLLAMKIYSTAVGVLLGFLTLVPCLGLIILLIVNSKATGILQKNGIKVGFLGANLSSI